MFEKIIFKTLNVGDLLISDSKIWQIVVGKTSSVISIKYFPDGVVRTFRLVTKNEFKIKIHCYTTRKYPVISAKQQATNENKL